MRELIPVGLHQTTLHRGTIIGGPLAGNAQLEGKGIAVTIDNSAVTLTWKVRTCAERHQADMTAWSAPGVTSATNDLIVSSNYDRKVRPY